MSAPRRFLVALAGTEDAALPGLVARVAGVGGEEVELILFHVVEGGPRELAAFDPGVRRGPWPLPKKTAIEQRLTEADDEGAAALLATWRERFAPVFAEARITHVVAQGRPEEQIIAAAQRLNVGAIVLCARPRTGATEPGPRSVGHVARFVVDHAPVPVLLVRSSAAVS